MAHNDIWKRILTLNIYQESCGEKTKHDIINICSSSTLNNFLDNLHSIVNLEPQVLKNYFLVICGINTNLEIIKYLIEDLKIDTYNTKNNYDNCLTLASRENTNLEIIRYLIENQKMNINYANIGGNNCLTMACWKNTNLEIIRYLIDDQKMNINHINNNGYNCLTLACRGNTNLEIIKYLIFNQKMNINSIDNDGNNCLTMACWENTNLEIIRYLIEEQKMNINHVNNNGSNCLILACYNNTNLEIIRYLIENQKMNINHINYYGNNCLTLACWENTNLEIIRYLIENQKMNINHTNNNGNNCLTLACWENTNLEIIRYLIENTDVKITINKMPKYSIWEKIILGITKNWGRYSEIFNNGIKIYNSDDIAKFVKVINPLLLMQHAYLYLTHCIYHPFDDMCKYKDFAKHVEDLKFPVSVPVLVSVPVSVPVPETEIVEKKTKSFKHDYRKNNIELLFIYNNEKYYGHRERVYDSIICLKEIKEIANFDDPIILAGSIPIYVMNMWIESIYTKIFDITEIQPNDIICFLKHIDQYPTDILSIDKIEQNLIEYFDMMQYNVSYDMYLRDICHKYKLKRLYLCLHNKKINSDPLRLD
jgi:hypothetical protein